MGNTAQPIHIRCPTDDHGLVPAGLLQNGALATSSALATVGRDPARLAANAASLRSGTTGVDRKAYSVVAPTCLLADALTKVLVQIGDSEADCFRYFGARAFITSAGAIDQKAA